MPQSREKRRKDQSGAGALPTRERFLGAWRRGTVIEKKKKLGRKTGADVKISTGILKNDRAK